MMNQGLKAARFVEENQRKRTRVMTTRMTRAKSTDSSERRTLPFLGNLKTGESWSSIDAKMSDASDICWVILIGHPSSAVLLFSSSK